MAPDTLAPAPVVVFAYARADHLRQTIRSLQRNPEAASTALHVICDGPRRPEVVPAVQAVREFVETIDGFASVRRLYRNENLGLARSIIAGVGDLLAQHERLIVLEDDLVLSPHFLRYMNTGLQCYADDAQVASIHGYCYPVGQALPATFFLRGADCWGWATWARAWRHFEPDGQVLLDALLQRRLTQAFDLDGAFPYTAMLADQVSGRNDSWAVRWHAACFLKNMLTLYPGRSLVENIGNDASGTHCSSTDAYTRPLDDAPVALQRIALAESTLACTAFAQFLRRQRPSRLAQVAQGLRRRLGWL